MWVCGLASPTPTPILERGEEKLFNRKGKGGKKGSCKLGMVRHAYNPSIFLG